MLGGRLPVCLSGEDEHVPSREQTEMARRLPILRRELMEVPTLSKLSQRALSPLGKPWRSQGLSPAALRLALDSDGDSRTAIVDAVLRAAKAAGLQADPPPDHAACGAWTPADTAEPTKRDRDAWLKADLSQLKAGGLWKRATDAGVDSDAIAAALDLPKPQRLTELARLIEATERERGKAVAERARASTAERSKAHELVWGDSEDEEDEVMELWFPRTSVIGPADLRSGLSVHISSTTPAAGAPASALDEMQRARMGQDGCVVQVDEPNDRVKVQFLTDGEWSYWRIMAKATVREIHDTRSKVIGHHRPSAFAKKIRGKPRGVGRAAEAEADPDFVKTVPGDENHLSRQAGYVVVVQEHTDADGQLWVLTKTAPPGASRGGWVKVQTKDHWAPGCQACCGSRPLRGGRGYLLEKIETSQRVHTMIISECGEPGVEGTYRRHHEASDREHFVNEHGMHFWYVPLRKEWHLNDRLFGNEYHNLVLKGEERLRLTGRHQWRRGRSEEDEQSESDDEDAEGLLPHSGQQEARTGELFVKVLVPPAYRCS
jgi:hypothetical protein